MRRLLTRHAPAEQFLFEDEVLLAAALLTAAESLRAARR
jgi:hypothetical protein